MAARNNNLGGNDYTRESPTWQDANDTNNAILSFAGVGIAQNAYQILQSNNVFDNKDYLCADEFTDSTGTNNTVNTGSSTAVHNSTRDDYALSATTGTAETSGNTSSYTSQSASFSTTVTIANQGFFSTIRSQNAGSGGTLTISIIENSETIASKSFSKGAANTNTVCTFTENDYTRLLESGQTVTISFSATNAENIYNNYTYSGTDFSISAQNAPGYDAGGTYIPFEFTDSAYDSGDIVTCDSGTLTLDGTEKSLIVYTDSTIPTGTSITVDISDGTTTLSSQSINSVIDLSTLVDEGTLEITFNLMVTDTAYTPRLRGYGVYLYK